MWGNSVPELEGIGGSGGGKVEVTRDDKIRCAHLKLWPRCGWEERCG